MKIQGISSFDYIFEDRQTDTQTDGHTNRIF